MQKLGIAFLSILLTLLEVGCTRSATATQNRYQMTGASITGSTLVAKACTQRRYRRPQ